MGRRIRAVVAPIGEQPDNILKKSCDLCLGLFGCFLICCFPGVFRIMFHVFVSRARQPQTKAELGTISTGAEQVAPAPWVSKVLKQIMIALCCDVM